jgi:hypothetical protein
VLKNSAHAGLKVWIKGKPIVSDVIDQAWQDRLARLSQRQINEAVKYPSLIDLDAYKPTPDDYTSVYTHKDG